MEKEISEYREDLLSDLRRPGYASQYVSAAMRESHGAFLIALKDVADAQLGVTKLAENAGMNRKSLYRTLSEQGNPRLSTLESLLGVLGFELTVRRKGAEVAEHTRAKRSTDRSARRKFQ